MTKLKLFRLIFIMASLIAMSIAGCSCPYSFTGASIPPHLKSLAIPYAQDQSGSGEPQLVQSFTTRLTQKFIDDNSFVITDKTKADAVLECAVLGISDTPAAITTGEQVQSRRLNLTIQVAYKDLKLKKTIYERQFSNYADYAAATGQSGRNQAIDAAIEKLTEDILLETVSGW
ncbi:MAG: LPS assembly lipoprotein LptE [Bacteroidetes bacterium]|nr:LPS assembly lipoprotein LptE [Bacteroidota bacterium]